MKVAGQQKVCFLRRCQSAESDFPSGHHPSHCDFRVGLEDIIACFNIFTDPFEVSVLWSYKHRGDYLTFNALLMVCSEKIRLT